MIPNWVGFVVAAMLFTVGLFGMLLSSPRVYLRLTLREGVYHFLMALAAFVIWAPLSPSP